MRLKYYLRGLGIGIVLATLLLSISFYFGKDSLAKRELSDQEKDRRAAGKPEKGTIFLNAFQEGNNVIIEVGDDGAGIG